MKLLIFSDTHLTKKFDPAKFRYLLHIISSADKVIINGDFWDMFFTTFDEFVNSEWNQLFPVLKQKQAVYIYGNHDEKWASDERANLFSVSQVYHYDIDADGLSLHVEHGQRMIPQMGMLSYVPTFISVRLEFILRMVLGRFIKVLLQPLNDELKAWIKYNLPGNQILVCGHTHLQEDARSQRLINSGFNLYGFGQYLMVENGEAKLNAVKYNQPIFNVNVAQA